MITAAGLVDCKQVLPSSCRGGPDILPANYSAVDIPLAPPDWKPLKVFLFFSPSQVQRIVESEMSFTLRLGVMVEWVDWRTDFD